MGIYHLVDLGFMHYHAIYMRRGTAIPGKYCVLYRNEKEIRVFELPTFKQRIEMNRRCEIA
jgi:hypothetical protein